MNVLSFFSDEIPQDKTGVLVINLGFMNDFVFLNTSKTGKQDLLNTAAGVTTMLGLVLNVSKCKFIVDNSQGPLSFTRNDESLQEGKATST